MDRKDIQRFSKVSRLPQLVNTITALRFETGVMDIPRAAEMLGFEYVQVHNSEIERSQKQGDNFDLEKVEKIKADVIKEYAAWNTRFHEAQQDYQSIQALPRIFKNLRHLQWEVCILDAFEKDSQGNEIVEPYNRESYNRDE